MIKKSVPLSRSILLALTGKDPSPSAAVKL